ncbi:MAG TPA: OmpA family protein [Candidatus Kapabacteria bacterium]|nr:OmpA family protein [Candidatus Kapabacteria bacterium]
MKLLILLVIIIPLNITLLLSNVQWAKKVIAFSSQASNLENSANQILGKPNIMPGYGNSDCAWMPQYPSRKVEWIKVQFNNPIYIKQVAVNENYNSGAIVKITVYDSLGNGYAIYNSNTPEKVKSKDMLRVFPDGLDFRSNHIRIDINTALFTDYYQIDAIAISDNIDSIKVKVNEIKDSTNLLIIKENLGNKINSASRELAPIISADGDYLFFTRDGHPDNIGPFRKQDIWMAVRNPDNSFSYPTNLKAPLNDENVNFAVSLSADANKLLVGNIYLTNGNYRKGLSFSTFDGEYWSFPDSLIIDDFYNLADKASYNLSANGKILLLAIKRKDTFGKTDIYVSFLQDNATWSKPKNLGNVINTAEEEISPFLASDNKTIYYSTSGYPGYGSSDMFLSKRLDDTWENWSEPINLGSQINTKGWDAYYSITASGEYAYFVSSENSIGYEDIFRVKLPQTIKPEAVILVKGKVINAKSTLPIKADIKFELLPSGKEAGIATSNKLSGEFRIVLPAGKKYGFRAVADGYISINENINLENLSEYDEKNIDLSLYPIEVGTQFRINNIFFDTGKANLLEDSYSELNRLVDFLAQEKEMTIVIIGHTDNVGDDKSNLELSKKRALAVKEYLVNKGIAPERIKSKGLGESKPLGSNSSEVGRQKNRRVEFEIISK